MPIAIALLGALVYALGIHVFYRGATSHNGQQRGTLMCIGVTLMIVAALMVGGAAEQLLP